MGYRKIQVIVVAAAVLLASSAIVSAETAAPADVVAMLAKAQVNVEPLALYGEEDQTAIALQFRPKSTVKGKGGYDPALLRIRSAANAYNSVKPLMPVVSMYVDPWVVYEKSLTLEYRNVKYIYNEYGEPIGIAEEISRGEDINNNGILDWGEDTDKDGLLDLSIDAVICKINRFKEFIKELDFDYNGVNDSNDTEIFISLVKKEWNGFVKPDLNLDLNFDGIVDYQDIQYFMSKIDGLGNFTILTYLDKDGMGVRVEIAGEPNWGNLLASASIADGVFYGVNNGSVVKAKNIYDLNGRKLFGVMKIWHFDGEGKLRGTEVIKESLTYNKNGDLVSEKTSYEVNGRLTAVKWVSYLYDGSRVLRMKSFNEIHYNDDGTIGSSKSSVASYDRMGRETSYSAADYVGGKKTHSIKRSTVYGLDGVYPGGLTHVLETEEWYDDQGQVTRTGFFEKSVTWDEEGGIRETKETRETSWPYNGAIWSDVTSKIERVDMMGRMVMNKYTYEWRRGAIARYAYQNSEGFRYGENYGDYGHYLYSSHNYYDDNGTWTSGSDFSNEEEYKNGRIVRTRNITRSMTAGNGGVVLTYENEDIVLYEYDQDGDLVSKIETNRYVNNNGYEGLVTREYQYEYILIGGVKKLASSRYKAVDSTGGYGGTIVGINYASEDFKYEVINGKVVLIERVKSQSAFHPDNNGDGKYDISYEYNETEACEYDERGNLLARRTVNVYTQYNNGEPIYTSTNEINLAFAYDENDRVILQTRVDYYNGEMSYMELAAYSYHENGILQSVSRHSENLWQGMPYNSQDDVRQYNEQGNLILHSYQDNYGSNYLEERMYAADGKTMIKLDIASENYWKREEIYRVGDSDVIQLGSEVDALWRRQPYNHYELHEKYREDGKIYYREESGKNSGWYWWGGSNAFSKVENWEYDNNGNLIRYVSESEREDGWWGPIVYAANDNVMAPESWPTHYGTNKIKESLIRDYDPETGKVVREEHTIGSERWNGLYWDAYVESLGKDFMPNIPEDGAKLVADIGNFFMSFNYDGYTWKKMIVEYDKNGRIDVKFIVTDNSDKTISALTGSIETDKDGKIVSLKFSYAGDRQDEWEALIEGLKQVYPPDKIVLYQEDGVKKATVENPDLVGALQVKEIIGEINKSIPDGVKVEGRLADQPETVNGVKN